MRIILPTPVPPTVRSRPRLHHPRRDTGGSLDDETNPWTTHRRRPALPMLPRAVSIAVAAIALLCCSTTIGITGASAATPPFTFDLPPEFSIRGSLPASASSSSPLSPTTTSLGGLELVWDPTATRVHVGGARPEFRLGSDVLLGYPKETLAERSGRFVLALPLTRPVQAKLTGDGGGGATLQVWSSGRRIDAGATPADTSASPDPSTTTSTAAKVKKGMKGKAAPTVPTNPAKVGPYTSRRRSYDLPTINVTGYPAPLEVVAEVTYPRMLESTPSSLGPAPLVLFLHGRHTTCYRGENVIIDWPCYPGYSPIPSHKGYRYVTDILASQGYVAVSIAANGVNGQDGGMPDNGATARSILVRHHLDLWATWNAGSGLDPWGGLFKGKLDLTKVVLVGHSRGGEGINRAAIDATNRDETSTYKIVGLVSYGPTTYGWQVHPGVPSATILPTCDGDVSDLEGQAYVDSSRDVAYSTALRSAVIVIGANHNYFNTEWTPGLSAAPADDDWSYIDFEDSDPVCSSTNGVYRLTAQEQRVVGATYTLALVRLVVHQEQDMLPLLDGSFVRPKVVGRADVVTHAVGGAGYRLLYKAESLGSPQLGRGMKGHECQGYLPRGSNNPLPVCSDCRSCSPHFVKIFPNHPAPQALVLRWNTKGAIARFKIDRSQRDFRALDSVDVRVANDPGRTEGSMLEMWLVDGQGRFVKLDTSLDTIDGWPGTDVLDRIHARSLRGSLALDPKTEFNLKNVTQVALVARSATGKVFVLDVAANQRQIAAVPDLNLPVVSVELLKVLEGDGLKSATVKVTSDRPFPSNGAIWIDQGFATGFPMQIPSGANNVIVQFSISWVGDNVYDPDEAFGTEIEISAMTGAIVGNVFGGIDVIEDEVKPTVTPLARRVTVNEGKDLVWNFVVSSPNAYAQFYLVCLVVPPTRLLSHQTELSTHDVPRQWLIDQVFDPPPFNPAVPLSDVFLLFFPEFDRLAPSSNITFPTLKDGVAETKDEVVSLFCTDSSGYFTLGLTGVVRANSS